MKGWKKIYQANGPPKQVRLAIILSDKVDFKLKLLKRDKEDHCTLIKRAIHQEEIIIINSCVLNFIKYILNDLKPHINLNTVVVGDFNTPLSTKDRSSRQKSTKKS
jgi:hypothetical protein